MSNVNPGASRPETPRTLTPEELTCCGGPATGDVDACCVRDADAKAAGVAGCGCRTGVGAAPQASASCC